MAINDPNQYRSHLRTLCKKAYKEGRDHEKTHNNPDVGWSIDKYFEDTVVFAQIGKMLTPKEHLRKLLKDEVKNDIYK